MDEIEVNGNGGALHFDAEADDPFAIPPPLDGSLLVNDPGNIADQIEDVNPEDNVDGEQTQDSAEKKKKKRAFKPRVNLNEERLCSTKGIEALKNLCSDVNFKGKGHELSDLNKLLHRFEHWAQCLMPRWPFDNVVQKCEVLGSKSRVKNELKRIRRSEEEILRGEPEDDEEGIGVQADTTNEENLTEATSQQDVPQEETPPVEINDEQRDRIRRNRELAFERREAKKRRLEEESQTQSQLDNETTDAEQEIAQKNSSSEPHLTNIRTGNTTPEETLEDIVPDEMYEDIAMNGDQNISMDNINNEDELNDVAENDSNEIVSHNNIFETDDFSQVPNMNNEQEQEENDISDEDDEILNRSAFDLNPTNTDASLSVDTNNELNTRKDEVFTDHLHNKVDDNMAILKNDRQETDSSSSDNATEDINSFPCTTENIDLPNASSRDGPEDTVKVGANLDGNTSDNPTIE